MGGPGPPAPPSAPQRKSSDIPTRVKSLQSLIDDTTQTLKQLTLENYRVRERERMGELVLAAQTRVHDCCAEIRAGLSHNPFEALLHATVDEVRNQTPAWIGERYERVIYTIVALRTSGATLLRAHPELLGPPAELPQRPVRKEACGLLLLPPSDPLLAFKSANEEEAAQHRDLVRAAEMTEQLSFTMRYMCMVCPEAAAAVSGHHKHVMKMSSWGDVRSTFAEVADTAAKEPAAFGPMIAPEEHWQRLVVGLHLSDMQRLRASVLRDIFIAARQAVEKRRVALTNELAGQKQAGELGLRASGGGLTTMAQLSQEEACMARLSATINEDRYLGQVLDDVLILHLLTPLQAALAVAYSAPYVLDAWAVVHAAAEQCTDTAVSELASMSG